MTDSQTSDATPPESTLLGYIDHADWHEISGWGHDPRTPEQPLWLEVLVDDEPPVAFLANLARPDLAEAGYGDGKFGFRLRFPIKLDPLHAHRIVVRRREDGRALTNAPIMLARAPMASKDARTAFEAAVAAEIAAIGTGPELDVTTTFLLAQVDRLLQARADTESGATALQHFRLRWSDHLPGHAAIPPVPDQRPWALLIDRDLPDTGPALTLVQALQEMGLRVAVTATADLRHDGATAKSLEAMDVTVHGAPEHFTVEDILRRHRGLYRAVVLRGVPASSAYAVLARQHQPRARVLATLGDIVRDRADPILALGAALLADAVIVDTEDQATKLRTQLAGRSVFVLSPDATTKIAVTVLGEAGIPSMPAKPAGTGIDA
jgi:hypothetical protein